MSYRRALTGIMCTGSCSTTVHRNHHCDDQELNRGDQVGIGVLYGPLFIRLKISNLKNVNLASQEARSWAGRSDDKQDG